MTKPLSTISTKQFTAISLKHIFKGALKIKRGHLPQTNHQVPNDFIGVCVASNEDPEIDAYIIGQLETLGVNNVRLDFSYEDLDSFNERFLQKLIAAEFNVTLHLLPPFDAAKNMNEFAEQENWRAFLAEVLDRHGATIKQVEIGNTINRKRWAGYTLNGFLTTWQIAHAEVKSRSIKLLGPNIQDFEPIYNIGILNILQESNLLPDVHTDNLFVERVSEPERFDHRILKYKWSRLLKYNLIKKARILQKVGQDAGVSQTSSAAAFWAIYRIKRLLVAGEQKQADYLSRYFTLLAASGALQQANWGAFICNREGLINDGLTDAEYPDLERIAHYQSTDGMLNEFERYPSFYAMQSVVKYLSGAHYQSAIATAQGLEVHHFNHAQTQLHVAWTINGKVAYLADIYTENTLNNAKILHRDGSVLDKNTELACETPIYCCWDKSFSIEVLPKPKLVKNLAIHAHIQDTQYFRFNQNSWSGLILAKNTAEANQFMQTLNPDQLIAPQKNQSLRHARNVIWAIEDPRDASSQLTIKQPVKMYPHKAFLDRFKPSKAKRSWNGAMELSRRGVGTAQPIAYFEKAGDKTLKQNFYICEHVKADCSIGELFSTFAHGEEFCHGLTPKEVYSQFAQFSHNMHSRGIYFRDYSGGNILVTIHADNQLEFSLIDTARLRSFDGSIPLKLRVADLTRACHKLHGDGRKRFMQSYLGLSGRKFNLYVKSKFLLYDFKVKLKRTIGRKGIKKLMKRLKQQP
ncbi:MAG: lipopolysaccharide kinase InaA family protein [Methylophilaceae bacterium]